MAGIVIPLIWHVAIYRKIKKKARWRFYLYRQQKRELGYDDDRKEM